MRWRNGKWEGRERGRRRESCSDADAAWQRGEDPLKQTLVEPVANILSNASLITHDLSHVQKAIYDLIYSSTAKSRCGLYCLMGTVTAVAQQQGTCRSSIVCHKWSFRPLSSEMLKRRYLDIKLYVETISRSLVLILSEFCAECIKLIKF